MLFSPPSPTLQDRLLEEQKSVLQQIHDERTSLADERAQFNMTRQLVNDESQRVTSRNMRSEIEVESTVKAINNEKAGGACFLLA